MLNKVGAKETFMCVMLYHAQGISVLSWVVLGCACGLERGNARRKAVDRPVGRKTPEPTTWELQGSFQHVDWGRCGSLN